MMKLCLLALPVFLLLCSCGSARTEVAKSLSNAKEISKYLLGTELDENQYRAVSSIDIAVDPGIRFTTTDWMGRQDPVSPTVSAADWTANAEAAKVGVAHQAAKANAAMDAQFQQAAWVMAAFWGGISLLFGAGGVKIGKKILNLKGALHDAIQFGNEALTADNDVARQAVKEKAVARKRGTAHAKELDHAMVEVRSKALG